jgi:hypothetical protein
VTGIDERSRALLKEWLLSFPRSEGFLALGLRFPNKTSLSESFDRSFPLPALEQTWRGVADTFKVLDLHRLPAERMLWRYRDLWLAAVRRPDGCTLSLVISSQAASALTHQTGQLQDAFLALGK